MRPSKGTRALAVVAVAALVVGAVPPFSGGLGTAVADDLTAEVVLLPQGFRAQEINERGQVLGFQTGDACRAVWDPDGSVTPVDGCVLFGRLGPNGSVAYIETGEARGGRVWTGPGETTTLPAPPGEALEIVFDPETGLITNIGVPLFLTGVRANTAGGVVAEHGPADDDTTLSRYPPPGYGRSAITTLDILEAVAPDGRMIGISAEGGGERRIVAGGAVTSVALPVGATVHGLSSASHVLMSTGGTRRVWHDGVVWDLPAGWSHVRAVNRHGIAIGDLATGGLGSIGVSHPELGDLDLRELVGDDSPLDGFLGSVLLTQDTSLTDSCRFLGQGYLGAGFDDERMFSVHLSGCDDGEVLTVACEVAQSGPGGSQLTFTADADIPGGATATYAWTFSDDTVDTGSTVHREATLPGAFTGTVEASAGGQTDQAVCDAEVEAPTLGGEILLVHDDDTISGSVTYGEELDVVVRVTASNGLGALTDVTLDLDTLFDGTAIDRIEVLDGPAPEVPDAFTLEPVSSETFVWRVRAVGTGAFRLDTTLTAVDAADRAVGPVEIEANGMVASGLLIELDARAVDGLVEVTTTVTNLTDEDLTELTTTGPVVEAVVGEDGPLPVPLGEGVSVDALPTVVAAGDTVEARTTFEVVGNGIAVLVEEVTASTDDGPVTDTGAVTVGASDRDVEDWDLELAALEGVRESLRVLSAEHAAMMDDFHAELREVTDQPLTPQGQAQVDTWRQLGFSEEWARTLTVWENHRETWDVYVGDWKKNFDDRLTERLGVIDETVRRAGTAFLETITDLERIEAISRSLVDSGLDNLGYLGDALMVEAGEGLAVAWEANSALATRIAENIGHAWQGWGDLRQLERLGWINDPVGTARASSERHAGYAADATIDFSIGLTAEVGTAGAITLAAPALRELGHGINRAMSTQRANPLSRAAVSDNVADALTDPMVRLARLEQALADDLGRLPTGTQLPLDESLLRQTGMSADDARAFMAAVDDVTARYPQVDGGLTATFRAAEPASAHVPGGRGKEEWNKFKAMGPLDEAMGGSPLLRGQASVFDAKPLPIPIVQTLDGVYPGFAKITEERYRTQIKNWADHQAGRSDMSLYVRGSQAHGNIRIINDRPGAETFGVRYLEQLDELSWRQASGLNDQQIVQLRSQLEAHPGLQPPVAVLEQRIGDNAVGFSRRYPDGTIAPDVSDFDLQFLGPVSGEFPAGLKGQIITDLHQAIKKNPRVPMHGASDLGFDISTELFDVVSPYMMAPYHAASAPHVAASLQSRVGRIAQDLRRRADQVEAAFPGTALAAQRAQRLRSRADEIAEKVTVDWLVSKAAGEKMITITPGDIRVGGGL